MLETSPYIIDHIETPYTNIVYYNDDHSKTADCAYKMRDKLNITFSTPSTWHELIEEFEQGAKFLVFHVDNITKLSHTSASEFLEAVHAIAKFIPACKDLIVGVIVTPTTSRDTINYLQRSGVQGLLLDLNHYTVEEASAAANAFINHIPYWPKHIMDSFPVSIHTVNKRLLSVHFREDWVDYFPVIDRQLIVDAIDMNVEICSSWDELDVALTHAPHQIVVHIETIKNLNVTIPEIMSMLETRLKLAKLSSIKIAVAIEPHTLIGTIKELKKAGVHGIVPSVTHWGLDECVTGILALRDRTPYWPKHIIDQLPGNAKKKTSNGKINLTNRQEQVFRYIIERGASNKVIAKSLGISESAVKLHVTEILRKHGVKNRTQLAVFSKMPA